MTSGSPDVIGFFDTYPNVPELEKNETQPVRFEFMLSPIGFEFSESDEVVCRSAGSGGVAESVEAVGASEEPDGASAGNDSDV
jgi:hypothetical protein